MTPPRVWPDEDEDEEFWNEDSFITWEDEQEVYEDWFSDQDQDG